MARATKFLAVSVGLGLVGLAMLWLGVMGWAGRALRLDAAVTTEIAPGTSVAGIAQLLADTDAIENPRLFVWYVRVRGEQMNLKAGEYRIEPGTTPAELVDRLVAGEVLQHTIRLVEGTTVRDVLDSLADADALRQTLANSEPTSILSELGLGSGHAEGWFFPDTYQFERGTADVEILRRAYTKMQSELPTLWQLRDLGLPYADPYDALIMASIIEKETGLGGDRDKISGVFVRRLQSGMRLQTDPTVIYGLGMQFGGNLTRRHLQTDGPYNTYRNHGLPPTPISLPSRDSIYAALHPAEGDEMYFVARGDGTSQFSATLEEHRAAVQKFQIDVLNRGAGSQGAAGANR